MIVVYEGSMQEYECGVELRANGLPVSMILKYPSVRSLLEQEEGRSCGSNVHRIPLQFIRKIGIPVI